MSTDPGRTTAVQTEQPRIPARVTFVLGGGGGPGVAYLSGALRALADTTGLRLADADLAIGTSAGSVVASRLAVGHSFDEIDRPARPSGAGLRNSLLVPRWDSRLGLARRAVGAGFAVSRSLSRIPTPARAFGLVERLFPPGLFAVDVWDDTQLPEAWPDMPLWLVTADAHSGRRIVLRRPHDGRPHASLRQAVAASCAVPGVFMPERIGRHDLVDGGVHSSTNVDLAIRVRSQIVIALAPMGYDPGSPIARKHAAAHLGFNRRLRREAHAVRRSGGKVLFLRPAGVDIAGRGRNIFSQALGAAITQQAYDTTVRQLGRTYERQLVEETLTLLDLPRGDRG